LSVRQLSVRFLIFDLITLLQSVTFSLLLCVLNIKNTKHAFLYFIYCSVSYLQWLMYIICGLCFRELIIFLIKNMKIRILWYFLQAPSVFVNKKLWSLKLSYNFFLCYYVLEILRTYYLSFVKRLVSSINK